MAGFKKKRSLFIGGTDVSWQQRDAINTARPRQVGGTKNKTAAPEEHQSQTEKRASLLVGPAAPEGAPVLTQAVCRSEMKYPRRGANLKPAQQLGNIC